MNTSKPALFTERQYFRQPWLWVILLLIDAAYLVGVFMVINSTSDYTPNTIGGLVVVTIIVSSITILFLIMKLETFIKEDGIYYKFYPFHKGEKRITWGRINKSFIRKYSPLGEYGGWGIRSGFGSGMAYNVFGNIGLQLYYDNSKKLLIGTQKAEEMQAVIHQVARLHPVDNYEII